jgi:hypothetical protein
VADVAGIEVRWDADDPVDAGFCECLNAVGDVRLGADE